MTAPATTPLIVTVNVDIETQDAAVAGGAGLFGRYSYGRYGAREGVWRLLDTFADEGISATFFVDGDDAGRHPHVVEAILEGGHEVAQLGPPGIDGLRDRAALQDRIGSARDTLARVAGRPITGWRAADLLLGEETLPALAAMGIDYDSSFQDDDQPYLFGEGDGPGIVELPSFRYLTDSTFYTARRTDATVRKAWAEEFAAMHTEGSYVLLTVHSRGDFGSGRALRTRLVGDWLHTALATPGVESLTCAEMAARTRALGPKPEPFPTLLEFAQDAAP